jgi:hypothetical protein
MTFRPWGCHTRWEGLIVAFWIVLIDLLLLIWMERRPIDWLKFGMILMAVGTLPLLGYVLFRTWAAFSLHYWIDRNAVTVHWASFRQVIPLQSVQRVIDGGLPSVAPLPLLQWPAPYIGPTSALGLANVQMLATRPLEECLLLDTGEIVFALSPRHEEAFLEALQARYRLGPVATPALARMRSTAWQRLFGQDQWGPILLACGLVGTLLLFGILMVRFPNLPDAMAFHYNSQGLPDVVREKTALFLLPAIGLMAWLINGVWGLWMAFRQQRTGAYMLWGGTLIVQICSYMALTSLMD